MKTPWEQIENQALAHMRALVQLDTSNPPGNERIAADYFASVLARDGIQSVIQEGAPTRANLVARIKGSDPSKAPLLISSHTDVVPVETEGWTRPPFSAEIANGYVWGRGTIDMKAKCAMDLTIMAALKRAGVRPERDLILAAVADEESGSEHGAKFLVEKHPDLVRAGFVLNEVGGFTMHFASARFYPIQVAEKGFVTVRMTVRGQPGHGSTPRTDSAIARMAELITRIVNTPMRRRVTPLVAEAFKALGVSPDSPPELLHPMLANTVAPTMLRAGYKDNVVPGEASVVLDGRTLPGDDVDGFIRELRMIVGPEPDLELLRTAPPMETSTATPLFELIKTKVEAADPGAQAIAWMIPGATDSKFYMKVGAACYGFTPVKLKPDSPFGMLYHSNDERVPIDGFYWGLRVYADVVTTFLGLRFEDVFD